MSARAITENVARIRDSSGRRIIADLRCDAWGHGIPLVAKALRAAGLSSAVVDAHGLAALRASGLREERGIAMLDGSRLYGLPGTGGTPVMTVVGRVLSTKRLLEGEGVSYNHTHHAGTDTLVALVSGGFGQGLPRALGNHAEVEIGGGMFPIIGRVAMDVCVVDTGEAHISTGDEVTFFGGHGPARDALADWERTTGWTAAEMVCAIGLRVTREDAP